MPSWTLITGAAKGIGAALALQLAQEGHPLLLHFRHSQKEILLLAKACKAFGVEVELIQGDFTTSKQTQAFINICLERYVSIRYLICCVGPYALGNTQETSDKVWRDLFETNFFSVRTLISALLPALKSQGGSIVTLGVAGVGDARAESYASAYFTAKKALWTYTRTLAKEIASDNVSVNMVSPGRLTGAVDALQDLSRLPMKREGTAEEVARVIAFLLHTDNRYITGQQIEVAGGVRL